MIMNRIAYLIALVAYAPGWVRGVRKDISRGQEGEGREWWRTGDWRNDNNEVRFLKEKGGTVWSCSSGWSAVEKDGHSKMSHFPKASVSGDECALSKPDLPGSLIMLWPKGKKGLRQFTSNTKYLPFIEQCSRNAGATVSFFQLSSRFCLRQMRITPCVVEATWEVSLRGFLIPGEEIEGSGKVSKVTLE